MPSSPTSTSVPAGHAVAHLAVEGRVADDDDVGAELGRLGHEHVDRALRRQRVDAEALGLARG